MSTPQIITEQTHCQDYYVLGIENKKSELIKNPNCGACWNEFFQVNGPDRIKPYQTKSGFLGVFCTSEYGYWNYLIGGVVSGITEAPKGMYLRHFPESEYCIVTHEWVDTTDEADAQIGRIVGYAHGNWQCPEGYEKYTAPIMFIEYYNYSPPSEDGKYRVEVWLPIRKKQ